MSDSNKTLTRQFYDRFNAGDLTIVDDLIAEGDKVFVRARMTGTHQGEFMGIPATGRTIDVGVADFIRFDNGLFVEHWGVMDTGALMQQLTGA